MCMCSSLTKNYDKMSEEADIDSGLMVAEDEQMNEEKKELK